MCVMNVADDNLLQDETHPLHTLSVLLYLACRDNEFTCDNGDCIPQSEQCDDRYNCRDGSDELNCRRFLLLLALCVV